MQEYQPPLTTSREEFLKDDSDQLFREAIYTWVLSVDKLLKCRSVFARILGLTSSQFAVLMGVASQQRSRGVTIKDLAEHVALASTHVTTEIGRLEAKGLLVKKGNEDDRRSVLVSLTPKGRKEIERVTPVVREANDLLFRGVKLKGLINAHVVARQLVANSDHAMVFLRGVAGKSAKPRSAGTASQNASAQERIG